MAKPEVCCGSPVTCEMECALREAYAAQHRGDNLSVPDQHAEEVAEPPKGWNPTPGQPNGSTPAPDRAIDVYYADGSTCLRTRSAYCNWSLDLGRKSLIGWRYSDPCCGSPVTCTMACELRETHAKQHRGGGNLYRPLQPATAADVKVYDEIASPYDTQVGGAHYKDMPIQPVQYILANGLSFVEGAVVKYVIRWRAKGGVEDLRKARHFLDMLIEHEEKALTKP
jgi:hypothetical protein